MNLFIIEKKGRKLDRKTARRSIPMVLCRNKRPVVSLPWGPRGWPGKHVAIVTALSLSPPSAVSVRRSVVYIGSAKSQQDQNLPWKAQRLRYTNYSWQRSFFLNRATCQKTSQRSIFHSPRSPTWHVKY